ncbi:hypothetical protein DIPPA_00848 [Diplonema papillatum]|nr:hypothetical protein DIPPA_00848 [Diplonema papillatum]
MEYFLVLLPCEKQRDGETDPHAEYKKATQTMGFRLAQPKKFSLPSFKVGTLDSLMECSDELQKLDQSTELSVQKILSTGEQLLLEQNDKSMLKKLRQQLLSVNVLERDGTNTQPVEKSKDIKSYLENWQWDEFKYTDVVDVSIKKIIEDLQRPVISAEELIKKKINEYTELKARVEAAERKVGGNMTVKDITQDVFVWNQTRKIDDAVLRRRPEDCEGSQLCLLFVVVTKRDEEVWKDYATWGISEEQIKANEAVKPNQTNYNADGVALAGFTFKKDGKIVDLSEAEASNAGGAQAGYGNSHDTGSPSNVLNGDSTTSWFDSQKKPIVIDFGKATPIDQYSFTTAAEAQYRDPVRWTLEGYKPPSADTSVPFVNIEVEGVGRVTVKKGQSEHSVMMEMHKKLRPPAGKRIVLLESSGLRTSAVYDQLEEGDTFTYRFEEMAGAEYSKKEESVDLGTWTTLHTMSDDYGTPTTRRKETESFKVSKVGDYTKYRFTCTRVRGHPERGPIPCGNGAVPLTSDLVATHGDQKLMAVMVFSQLAAHFKHLCRERKLVVREFEPVEETGKRSKTSQEEHKELDKKRKDKHDTLVRDVKIQFSEAYTAWIHMKAVRAFVEAILRYGLPSKYVSILFVCDSKSGKSQDEMRSKLQQHYSHLNPRFDLGEDANEANALQERYAYVSLRIPSLE